MNDNNLMQVLYDYLDAMFISKDKSINNAAVLQLLPLGTAINPEDFANALSTVNFENGSSATAENFAHMVNDAPLAQTKFVSNGKLEDVYQWIIGSAVAVTENDISVERKKLYDEAFALLHDKDSPLESKALTAYWNARKAYEDQIVNLNMASLEADHMTPKGQKRWALTKIGLDSEIKRAYEKLSSYIQVKDALDTVQTTFSDGVKGLLAREKEFYQTSAQTSDTGKKWHLCSAFPSDWYENDSMYTRIRIDNHSMKNSRESKCLSIGADSSFDIGIFSGSAETKYSKESNNEDFQSEVTGIEMEIAAVKIERPWLNETLFMLDGWKIDGHKKGHVSDGTFITKKESVICHNEGIMPLIPKYMLITRNVTMKGSFDKKLLNNMSENADANTSIGIGPFKIKGHTEYGKSAEGIATDSDDTSITIHTPQIIGYISSIVKMAPKDE